ncbi:MAG: hypothetical protein M3Q27_18675 [Actinomycetota bacterium]|nr:hypothetical protein [Actinomycetota bacterium]
MARETDGVPAESLVRGLRAAWPLPEGWTPVAAIFLIKCLDKDGEPTWAFRMTDGLSEEELLGALTIRMELLKTDLLEQYNRSDDDDE